MLEKVKEKYDSKERAAKHYRDNKDVLKEKAKNKHKNLTEEEKELKK